MIKYQTKYVTLDHKTSHRGQFFIDVWFISIGKYVADLKIWNLRVQQKPKY